MTLSTLDPGSTFADRYRIAGLVKAGGMGEVYEGVHVVTGRRCAIKVMLRTELRREDLRDRFLQEARVVAKVRSDHIVDVLDAGLDGATGLPFLVMELLDGEDLGERVGRDGPLPATEAVTCLAHVALALAETHRRGIVHRDIKPSNVFLTRRNDGMPLVKVLDFGVAKLVPQDVSAEAATSDVGTPLYMAPEQFRTEARVSAASDIYSLGMLAYTTLVGAHYWQDERGRSQSAFAFAGIAADGPREAASLRAARRGVTLAPSFDAWFAKCTAYQPADRFATTQDAVAELAVALDVPVPLMRLDETPDPVVDERSKPPARPAELPETVEESGDSHPPGGGHTTLAETGGSGRRVVRSALRLESEPPSAPSAVEHALPPTPDPAAVITGRVLALPASAVVSPKRPKRRLFAATAGVLVSTAAALVAASLARGPVRSTAPSASASVAPVQVADEARSPPTSAEPVNPEAVSLEDLPVEQGGTARSAKSTSPPERRAAPAEALEPTPEPLPASAPAEPPAPVTKEQRRGLYSRH